MSEQTAPERIAIVWSPEARADLRAIERETAMQILYCIDDYVSKRVGGVKKLKPPRTGFRLRCGDYRVFFDYKDENLVSIAGVRNRKDAVIMSIYKTKPIRPETRSKRRTHFGESAA